MPLPTRFASNIAIPMVNTNPNVTQRKPSNVRHAVVCVKGTVSHGNRPTDSRVMVMDRDTDEDGCREDEPMSSGTP